jgi:hypothetical protein
MQLPPRRVALTLLASSAAVTLGVGGGLATASWADPSTTPSAAAGHGGHTMPEARVTSATVTPPTSAPAADTGHGGHTASDPSMDPSMDMGAGGHDTGDHGTGDRDAGDHDAGGHGEDSGAPTSRPRAAVLGTFGVVNGGVLLAAAALRRRDRAGQRTNRRAGTNR